LKKVSTLAKSLSIPSTGRDFLKNAAAGAADDATLNESSNRIPWGIKKRLRLLRPHSKDIFFKSWRVQSPET